MAAVATGNFEPAGELKFGQVSLANLRVLHWDAGRLIGEMRDRVQRAPKLFGRAAVVVDFGSLSTCPGESETRQLLEGLREAGVCPVGLAFGTDAVEQLAVKLGLPVLAKFRAHYEHPVENAPPEPPAVTQSPEPTRAIPGIAAPIGRLHDRPVRSGQQIYAPGRDLIVTATVGAGAEVIADGSIHVYGALRGRALAGARGAESARIFCREFHAELVSIAGHYRVLEDLPLELLGKPVQIRLEGEKLSIEPLAGD